MAALSDVSSTADEVRRLGECRQIFETSATSVVASALRGLFPVALAAGLIAGARHWFPAREWKYYLICALAVGLFLNGVRVLVQAWRRRAQKVATFERGFAIWRHGRFSTF